MKIEVNTFKKGSARESQRKVVEEAMEFAAAYDEYSLLIADDKSDTKEMWNLMLEIGDVFTATANLCAKMGIDAQRCVDMVETKNIIRGYYDTIDS